MAASLKIQISFLHFSLPLIVFMPIKLGSEIAMGGEHLGNMTSKDLDLGKF